METQEPTEESIELPDLLNKAALDELQALVEHRPDVALSMAWSLVGQAAVGPGALLRLQSGIASIAYAWGLKLNEYPTGPIDDSNETRQGCRLMIMSVIKEFHKNNDLLEDDQTGTLLMIWANNALSTVCGGFADNNELEEDPYAILKAPDEETREVLEKIAKSIETQMMNGGMLL
jgi:hypothetical protein